MIKAGFRKPNLKKTISARTKGRATRAVKKAIIPGYNQKGMGWLHPKKKLYNTIYNKTTIDTRKVIADTLFGAKKGNTSNSKSAPIIQGNFKTRNDDINTKSNEVKQTSPTFQQQSDISLAHCGRVFREMCGWSVWLSALSGLVNTSVIFLFLWVILWLVTWIGVIDKK